MAEQGIRQFIDLGSGLPTQGNTHEAVSQVAPGARVVYVDHDPMVLAHARALLSGTDTTTVIQATCVILPRCSAIRNCVPSSTAVSRMAC